MIRPLLIVATAALLVNSCASVTPSHDILPRPNHIQAGVHPGDVVEITTKDGKEHKFTVVSVGSLGVESPDGTILYGEITSIKKRSWTEPDHPCGGGQPVGCSIPQVLIVLSDDYQQQAEKFHPACVTHDFCYRHGHATYGESRETCDAAFYEDMKNACGGTGGIGVLDVKDFGFCQVAASQTFEAVRRYGKEHFRMTTSSYCDYQ